MRFILLFLAILFTNNLHATVIARKPYHDDIYVCKKRLFTIAIEVTEKSVLKDIFTKSWQDQVNPAILVGDDKEAILHRMDEYNHRVYEIKRHLDIKFVSWRDVSVNYHPAFKMRQGSWEPFPNKQIERHRWLDFFEWYINEWNYDDNYEQWDSLCWALRTEDRARENRWKKEFADNLILEYPYRYQYGYEYDDEFNYYSIYDNYRQEYIRLDKIGKFLKQHPTKPARPIHKICPIDDKYLFDKKRVVNVY